MDCCPTTKLPLHLSVAFIWKQEKVFFFPCLSLLFCQTGWYYDDLDYCLPCMLSNNMFSCKNPQWKGREGIDLWGMEQTTEWCSFCVLSFSGFTDLGLIFLISTEIYVAKKILEHLNSLWMGWVHNFLFL